MGAVAFASGRYARAICDKCGLECKYRHLVNDGHWRNLRVCPECYDPRHPQERLAPVADPVALWRPTPQDKHPPTAPVLSGVVDGTTGLLTWTAATSADSRVAGYYLYRDEVQIADLEIETDYTGLVLVDPRSYNDENLAPGTYAYAVVAYDLRGLTSDLSNVVTLTVAEAADGGVSFDVTLGTLQSSNTGYGYEALFFEPENPPLTGAIDPTPASIADTVVVAVWAWESQGFELWFRGPLPTDYATLRIQADGGTVELDLTAPDDSFNDSFESWLYFEVDGIWSAEEVGQVRRITFLE